MSGEAAGPTVRRLADWSAADLTELADEYGTPLYVTDLDRVRENARRLLDAFPDAAVSYAVKAHTGRAVLATVRDAGLGAECASAGEVVRAIDAGYDAVQYTAVNPPAEDLDIVLDRWRSGVDLTVVAGARDTIDRLRDRGFDGRLALRVNPGVGAGHHEKVTTGGHAKFGVPYDRAPELLAGARADFDVVGIHAHAGSGISGDDLAAHRELVARMGDLAREVGDLEFVDVGGGFGVPYREDEPPLDLDAVADATREALGGRTRTLPRRRRGRPLDAREHGQARRRRRHGRDGASRRRRRRRHDHAPAPGDVRRLPRHPQPDRRAPRTAGHRRRPRL